MQASKAASSSRAWLFIKEIGKSSFPQIRQEQFEQLQLARRVSTMDGGE
jgi:hypothetical protein